MRTKTKQKQKVTANPKKATPFADAGHIVGSKISTMFNAPWAKGVGRWLGSGIGQIFGSGDYQVVGGNPSYNVLSNGNQIPKFNTEKQTNIICHREYLGDISGTTGFSLSNYPLNPGMPKTFPWLSTIAQNYQEYRFHGVIFEFRSLVTDFVTNGAPGVVVMAANYNADAKNYTTKQEMENSEYAVSVKPTRDLIHGIECATEQTPMKQLYIRSGSVPAGQDLRLYDLANFQFATQSNPTQNLGELWVSYCVEFFKPILPTDVGGNVRTTHVTRFSTSPTSPLGASALSTTGDLTVSVTPATFFAEVYPGNYYYLTIMWQGTTSAALAYPAITFSGCTKVAMWTTSPMDQVLSPGPGTVTLVATYSAVLLVNNDSTLLGFTMTGSPALPGGSTSCDITLASYSTEAI